MEFVIRRNVFIAENHFRPLIGKDECEYDHVLLGPRSSSVLPLQGCCHSRPRSNGNKKEHFFLNETRFRHSNGPITSQSKEGAKSLCVTRNEGKDSCDRKKNNSKTYVIRELMEYYG